MTKVRRYTSFTILFLGSKIEGAVGSYGSEIGREQRGAEDQ